MKKNVLICLLSMALVLLLAGCGCDQRRIGALSRASFAYAFPRRDTGSGMGPWVV